MEGGILMMDHLLTWIIFLPLVGALAILSLGAGATRTIKIVALATTGLTFLLSLLLWTHFVPSVEFSYQETVRWIPSLNIYYRIGIDGVSLLLILLTTLLMPLAVLASWKEITHRLKEYMFVMLVLETGMIGTFAALDIFLFYVFWEVMLIPMYFLIGIWGSGRRLMASIKFVLFTMVGSLLMLVAILYGYSASDSSFALVHWYQIPFTMQEQTWLFAAFALAFAIKVPIFPLHTWLPDAHTEAPTAGSVILAGVLLKMGTYGFYRFAMPLFPDAVHQFAPAIMILAVVGIIYGALVAMVQPDMKRLIAYSSVSHLGFVILGLFALNARGANGAVMQMISHGLSTGALFLLVGMIYFRRHTRLIADYGGIAKIVPLYTFFFIFVSLSSIGLPGLNNFVGEFLILLGSFEAKRWAGILAVTGVVFGAVYMLWLVERVFFGPIKHEENKNLKDLGWREVAILVPLCLLMVFIGIYPKPFLEKIKQSTSVFLQLSQRTLNPLSLDGVSLKLSPPLQKGD